MTSAYLPIGVLGLTYELRRRPYASPRPPLGTQACDPAKSVGHDQDEAERALCLARVALAPDCVHQRQVVIVWPLPGSHSDLHHRCATTRSHTGG